MLRYCRGLIRPQAALISPTRTEGMTPMNVNIYSSANCAPVRQCDRVWLCDAVASKRSTTKTQYYHTRVKVLSKRACETIKPLTIVATKLQSGTPLPFFYTFFLLSACSPFFFYKFIFIPLRRFLPFPRPADNDSSWTNRPLAASSYASSLRTCCTTTIRQRFTTTNGSCRS